MVTETTRFGSVEVHPDAVITASHGLIGFPDAREFVLLEHAPGNPFQWLQSLDDPGLAFLVVDPYAFFPDYEVEISDDEVRNLGIAEPEEARILTTVSIRSSIRDITTNLLGPLVISRASRRATQLVLTGDRYSTRQSLTPTAAPVRELQAA